MLAVNYSNYRKRLKDYCDAAVDDDETVIITRKNGKNVVMMGEAEYNNIMENLHIMGNSANYLHILKSIRQLEKGQTVTKTDADLEALLDE